MNLEKNASFSKSLLWKLQKNAYDKGGPRAWEITNNPYIAHAYAQCILAFLRDFKDELHNEEPLYIIDLGAGAGRFSYLLLKALLPLAAEQSLPPICLVLADNVESYLPFWNSHPQLESYFKSAQLDIAEFDPTCHDSFALLHSKKILSSKTLKNPLIAIANYFFAALPHSLYQFDKKGTLYEGKVSLSSTHDLSSLEKDPSLMNEVEVTFSYEPNESPLFEDPNTAKVLLSYQDLLVDHPFLLPNTAFQAIHHLKSLSNGNLAIIVGDKCRITTKELSLITDLRPVVSKVGDIHVDVNADALFQYTELLDGQIIYNAQPPPSDYQEVSFSNFALVFGKKEFSHTKQLCSALFSEGFTPLEHHKLVRKALSGHDAFSIDLVCSLIQLSHYDPQLLHFFAALAPKELILLGNEDSKNIHYQVMERLKGHFFWISKKDDEIGYTLARVLYYMKKFKESRELLMQIIQFSGETDQFCYFLGLCYQAEGNKEEAVKAWKQAVTLNPGHIQAIRLIESEKYA